MKKSIFILFAFYALCTQVMAQTAAITPEFSLRPYILNADKTLGNLEKVDATANVRAVGMGYGGSETNLIVFSPKSDKRFTASTLPRLIIKVEGGADPADAIKLVQCKPTKKRREFLIGRNTMTGEAKNVSSSFVNLEFIKLSEGIYEIKMPALLQGEYAFTSPNVKVDQLASTATIVKIYCFAVD
jgi:hypothetical protein